VVRSHVAVVSQLSQRNGLKNSERGTRHWGKDENGVFLGYLSESARNTGETPWIWRFWG
jgi:hypothetical protein